MDKEIDKELEEAQTRACTKEVEAKTELALAHAALLREQAKELQLKNAQVKSATTE